MSSFSIVRRLARLLSIDAALSLGAAGQDQTAPHVRDCDFYLGHAYPSTYNVELNASCHETPSIPRTAGPGLGLHATHEFDEGDTVAWVPESAHLWEPTIPWPIRHAVAEACEPRAYAEAVLAVALLVERRDRHSRFKAYVAALAQITLPELSNIATFARDHLRVLNVTRSDLVEGFELAMSCIEAAQAAIGELHEIPPTRGERLWAYGVVKSRAFRIRGRLALVPVLELANHAWPPNAEFGTQGPSQHDGALLRSLEPLEAGTEITVAYKERANNIEMLATYGFAVPENPSGVLLPFNFDTAFRTLDDAVDAADASDGCSERLSSPQLVRGAELMLEEAASQCLLERLHAYYDVHYTEIGIVTDRSVRLKAFDLIGRLCAQILTRYKTISGTLNRLQQHGQRVGDWLSLRLTHEAVEDMRLLQTCVEASGAAGGKLVAGERNDL